MLIYDVEDLIRRAKIHYSNLKDLGSEKDIVKLKELNTLLFTDATAHNIETLEEWLDNQEAILEQI